MSYDLSKLLVSCHIFNYVIPYLIDDGKPFRSCVQSQKTSYRNEYCKTGFCLLTSLIRSKSDWMMNLCKDELVKQPRLIAQRLNTDKKKLYFQDDEIIFFFAWRRKLNNECLVFASQTSEPCIQLLTLSSIQA